jgi:phospholipid/cholesterol/gamma-HCH transport system substrate-binding protein
VIKTAHSPLRLALLTGFILSCIVVLTYLWITFGGSVPFAPKSYRVEVAFSQANELATGADVRIAGVDVGKVVGLRLDRADNRTLATLEIVRQYEPIPRDTRATLRLKTLLGETFVELSAGDRSHGQLPDGGRLRDGQVQADVAIDQILSTFDPTTRHAFQTWMQSQAQAVTGQGQNINAALGSLPAFVDSGQRLLSTLDAQSGAVRGLVANTGTFFDAISRRQGEFSGLVAAADNLFQTTAARNRQLAAVFKALPAFELQSRLTLPALTRFAQQADPVVRALDPIASELTRTFATTAQLAPQLRSLFQRLGPLVTVSQRGLPALDTVLAQVPPLVGAFEPFLRNANPIVHYIGLYKHEITGFFGNVTAASQSHDVELPRAPARLVHYLRTSQTLSPSALALLPHPLGIDRNEAYRAPGAFNRLGSGLSVLDPAGCANGNPAPPSSAIPATLVTLVQRYVFRTAGRDIAAPACIAQGTIPGFSTTFPQLRADPPPTVTGGG